MLKRIVAVALALILLILPLAVRWLYFYQDVYKPEKVSRPDLSGIEAHVHDMSPFVDSFGAFPSGIVLVDLAHDNFFEMGELGVLQARLAARGQQIEVVQDADELGEQLRHAKALVVISPARDWEAGEIAHVREFVDRGGRLLLVSDATRFEMELDEFGSVVFDHDAAHINGLSAQFGVTFRPDYLYNTTENAGNFRNIQLTAFSEHDLTRGLGEVVFSAARSIVSEQKVLLAAGGDTRSSISERIAEIPVAVLAADGGVLALGDLTFMAESYHALGDNDRFVSNIADFLSGTQREYSLADFPFFFGEAVDLIYAGDPLLDSDLLESGSDLQVLFAGQGKELTVREDEDRTRDTLFFGLYRQAEAVEPYLAAAGITVLITDTEGAEDRAQVADPGEEQPVARLASSFAPTGQVTTTLTVTPALELTVTPVVTAAAEITVTLEVSAGVKNRLDVESLGEMVLTGTSLLLLQAEEERQLLVVLADTEGGLGNAVERLIAGNLDDCLLHERQAPAPSILALCPTGEVPPGDGEGGWQRSEISLPTPTPVLPITGTPAITDTVEPPEPVGEPEGSILVVALDVGEGRYDSLTGAEDYAAILGERYEVRVWSKARDGPPSIDDLLEYDLIIWSSGDFVDAFGDDESELFFLVMLEGMPVIVSGAYIGDADVESVQKDIQVQEASHPLAKGFGTDEVIGFLLPPSGSEYAVSVIEGIGEEEGVVVFVRGPDSEDAGAPSVFVMEDEFSGARIVFMGLPLYLLPEEPKARLVLNAVSWLLGP